MSVIVNLNTRQNPNASHGVTGSQVVKFIPGPRLYIKATDTTPTPVTSKSNGSVPSGWTDLGIVNGSAKISYTKDIKEVRTGMDEVLRQTYVGKKTAGLECSLSQFDDLAMANVSGLSASQIINGSTYQFAVGSDDVIQKALLLVLQNKLDGKEWQFYNPNAFMSFEIVDNSGELVLNVKADLPSFSWGGGSNEALFVQSIFA